MERELELIGREGEHEPASERVREAWEALPGEEFKVDYPESPALETLVAWHQGGGPEPVVEPVELSSSLSSFKHSTVELRISLADGTDIDFSDSVEGEVTTTQIVEALDRVSASVMAWVDMRRHQIEAH